MTKSRVSNHDQSRIVILQPAFPLYRKDFFARLFDHFGQQLHVYASRQGELGILDNSDVLPPYVTNIGAISRVISGVDWQHGAMAIPLKRRDILVIGGSPRAITTVLLLFKAKLIGARVVWWGQYKSSTSKGYGIALRTFMMKRANAIAFYTEQEVSDFAKISTATSDLTITGLNNGIDTTIIQRLRTEYAPQDRPSDLLFIGRVTKKAKFEILLKALAYTSCSKFTLDVIGDGEDLEAAKAESIKLGISTRIRWHGGLTAEEQISDIANKSKAFVYPGAVGLSLIHGFAYGLPAIVHNERSAHMPEFAAHSVGVNGASFTFGSASSLAETIASMLSDSAALLRYSEGAVETISNNYNTKTMAEKFITLIESILGKMQNVF